MTWMPSWMYLLKPGFHTAICFQAGFRPSVFSSGTPSRALRTRVSAHTGDRSEPQVQQQTDKRQTTNKQTRITEKRRSSEPQVPGEPDGGRPAGGARAPLRNLKVSR